MVGMLYVRYTQYSNMFNNKTIYEEELMVKNMKLIVKYVLLVPITLLEWVVWPIAKIHAGLNKASIWLKRIGT